ncbi:DUF1987 domain-containing protein [Bacteroidota bacterium]
MKPTVILHEMEIVNRPQIKELNIKGDTQNPTIILNKESNYFEFSGISIPDDAESFYASAIRWLEVYKELPNESTDVIFKMDFISPDSSKMITRVFEILQSIHYKNKEVSVKWYYNIDDEDIRSEGRDYSNIISFPFELINYKN